MVGHKIKKSHRMNYDLVSFEASEIWSLWSQKAGKKLALRVSIVNRKSQEDQNSFTN